MLRPRSLQARLILLVGACVMAAQLALALVLHSQTRDVYRFRLASHTVAQMAALCHASQKQPLALPLLLSRDGGAVLLSGDARAPVYRVDDIAASAMQQLAESWPNEACATPREVEARVEWWPRQRLWVGYTQANTRYWLVLPLFADASELGTRPLVLMLVIAACVATLAAICIGFVAAHPLRRVAHQLAARGSADQTLPVDDRAPAEVNAVVQAFNALLLRLERQAAEQALLLAGVSHDLKAPITRMKMRLELLPQSPERTALAADLARLERIAAQFTAYVSSAAPTTHRPTEDPLASIREVVEGFVPRHPDGAITLDCVIEAPPSCGARAVAWDRIADNLLGNALAHGGLPVTVRVESVPGWFRLRVTDAGPGLCSEDFATATQPFTRLDGARSAQGHCGLGLAIVRRLIEAAGGTVAAQRARGGFTVECSVPG